MYFICVVRFANPFLAERNARSKNRFVFLILGNCSKSLPKLCFSKELFKLPTVSVFSVVGVLAELNLAL